MSEVTEHQQVAALLCSDINVLARVAEDDRWSAADLRELIFRLKEKKDQIITDPVARENRYGAHSNIATLGKR